jgi:CheY-like chemotaxis protein
MTFGPKFVQGQLCVHHFRSIEQIIPSTLLDRIEQKVLDVKDAKESEKEETKAELSLDNLRVLVAEDNLVNQKVIRRILHRIGITKVDVVENGKLAVEQEASQPYDVVFMDQQMPVMGGVPACKLITSRTGGHSPPKVVFVTAHVSPSFENECKEAGSAGFLSKPYKKEQMEECIRKVLSENCASLEVCNG